MNAFEEASLLREFIGVLDRINSTLAVAEGYGPPSVIVRTLVYDDPKMLDDFARGIPRICRQGDGPCLRGASRPTP